MLRRLLESVLRIEQLDGVTVHVRVVDNDEHGSARETVDDVFQDAEERFTYAIEPRQNISHARNRALDMGPADYYVFVDDDEVVPHTWLKELVGTLESEQADAAFGPVTGRVPEGAPRWMTTGGFYDKSNGPQGKRLDWRSTRTSNTIVRGKWFTDAGFRLDPEYGRSGSSDTDLFRRIQAQGAVFVSAASSGVWEDVEPDRASIAWLLRRNYRNGLTFHKLETASGVGRQPLVRFGIRLVKTSFNGLVGLVPALFGNPTRLVRAMCALSMAWGGLNAWLRPADARGFVEYGTRELESEPEEARERAA